MRSIRPRPPRRSINWSATSPSDWWPRIALVLFVPGFLLVPQGWWSWVLLIALAFSFNFVPALPRKPLDGPMPADAGQGVTDEALADEPNSDDHEPPLSTAEFEALWQQAKESRARI